MGLIQMVEDGHGRDHRQFLTWSQKLYVLIVKSLGSTRVDLDWINCPFVDNRVYNLYKI